jgi:ArsR family transcriptional regulator
MNDNSRARGSRQSQTASATPRGTRSRRSGGFAPELARLAKALGHPARIEILRLLIERGDCQCGPIVDRLPLAQATVSQHLKVLKDAGLIRGEIDPPRVCYCVNPEAVQRLKNLVGDL